MQSSANARIKVLGTGCSKCEQLERLTKEILQDLDKDEVLLHLTDLAEIISYGVMSTPALVVDEKVLFAGRVPLDNLLYHAHSSILPLIHWLHDDR